MIYVQLRARVKLAQSTTRAKIRNRSMRSNGHPSLCGFSDKSCQNDGLYHAILDDICVA